MRISDGFIATALACVAAACATTPTPDVSHFAADTGANSFEVFDRALSGPDALVLPVVQDRQLSGPSCGAHVLASMINYWQGAGSVTGDAIYAASPPQHASGYSMQELRTLAQAHGLSAFGVRLDAAAIVQELESGRPVLIPVHLPSIYVQNRTIPGAEEHVVDLAAGVVMSRAGRVSELTQLGMVDHYVLVVGYQGDHFVVLEPIMGFRTISFAKLERYRAPFEDAALVLAKAG